MSGGSLGLLKKVASYLFEQFGPVTVKRGDICSGAGEAAQLMDFGICESHDVHDLLSSRVVVNWGKNPHTSGVHLLPIIKEARARGAKVITVDPVRTKAASFSDLFITPRPGGDFALAMAVARWLFENGCIDDEAPIYCDNYEAYRSLVFSRSLSGWAAEADVPAADAERLAALYGENSPGAILVGWGLARRGNGAAAVRALDALGAVSGNLGVAGGGVSYYFGRRTAFDCDFVTGAAARTLSEARLGAEILAAEDPPVRMIWVTAGNPVTMLPDSNAVRAAFEKSEFTVVVDTHPTDTTDVADLVLPTLTLLEDDDLLGAFGNHYMRESRPAVAPAGKARHEVEILQAVARRIGVGGPMELGVEDWKRRMMARLAGAGVDLERLREGSVRNPFAPEVLFEGRRFPTASGKVNLLTEAAVPAATVTADRPLTLMAISTPKAQSSQWAGPLPDGPPEVRVHPDAAAGVGDGETAMLQTGVDALAVTVVHDAAVRPDVALMEKGGMLRDGRCANALVRAVETDAGGGAAYYDEPARLVRVEP